MVRELSIGPKKPTEVLLIELEGAL
jgi:hypothetical protein